MSDYEDRIRRALGARAAEVDARPEPEELTDRIASRERRRTRALSAALVLALFAGPTLGFVAGRGGGDSDASAEAGDDGVTVDESGPIPEIDRENESGFASGGGMPSSGESEVLQSSEAMRSRALALSFAGPGEPLARVFVRDVGGTKIRVYRANIDSSSGMGPSWWEPPGWCFPSGYVQADVSTEDIVGVVNGDVYRELRDGVVGGTLQPIGIAEGAPLWIAVVQTPGGAARVRVTFPGGATDEMEPVDGIAVLVAPASLQPESAYYDMHASVEAFDAAGQSLGRGTTDFGYGMNETEFEPCQAPTTLPAPGPEQPADPAAARAAIQALFTGQSYGEITDAERLARIDDPSGLQEVLDQVANGPYADAVKGARTTFRDVVFLSATRAVVQTDIEVPGYPPDAYDNQFPEYVLVDGQWKQTRESFCNLIAGAGVSCP